MSQRQNFGKITEVVNPPNLIEIQLNSYVEFLQTNLPPSKRTNTGLQAVFKEVFPITSYDEKCTLDFHSYEIGDPKMPGNTTRPPSPAFMRWASAQSICS